MIVPENADDRSVLQQVLHNRRFFLLKTSMLFEPGVVVTDVPLLPRERVSSGRPLEPERSFVIVPVGNARYVTARAVAYARSLNAVGVEAIFLVTDNSEIKDVAEAWIARGFEVPLVMVEAPFRELGPPLLEEIRKHTARGDTIVTVVLPEVVPRRWWQSLLHGQTALYFKRLLLFEPHVVVTSVPLHLTPRRSPTRPEVRPPADSPDLTGSPAGRRVEWSQAEEVPPCADPSCSGPRRRGDVAHARRAPPSSRRRGRLPDERAAEARARPVGAGGLEPARHHQQRGAAAGGPVFEGIPDGIGAMSGSRASTVDVFVNHEQSHVPFPPNLADVELERHTVDAQREHRGGALGRRRGGSA